MIRHRLAVLAAGAALLLTSCGVSTQQKPVRLSELPSPPATTAPLR